MAEGAQIDGLVEKISDRVFKKLSFSLDKKLDQTAKSVNSVFASVTAVEKRVDVAEQRISDMEDSVAQLLAKLERTETLLTEAMTRLEDQENWSRRNNIKVINLPEHKEGDFKKILAAKSFEPHGEERPTQAGKVHTCRTTRRGRGPSTSVSTTSPTNSR